MKLVFLHGIGDGDVKSAWCRALCDVLPETGYRHVDVDEVIAPDYASLLRGAPPPQCPLPEQTRVKLTAAQAARERWEFERRRAALERLLEVRGGGTAISFPESLAECRLSMPIFSLVQARNYVSNDGLRGTVLQAVLKELPQAGEVVIVAHGLGSLVAIDLLNFLPQRLVVHRLITIGSPIGHLVMHGKQKALLKAFSLARVETWVNFLSLRDTVPYGRGIAHLFPQALDVPVELGMCEHVAEAYLRNSLVVKAIGGALFGSPRREIALIETTDDVPLAYQERIALAAIAYGHFLADEIKDERKRARFRAALHDVQQSVSASFAEAYASERRSTPAPLRGLADGQPPTLGPLLDLGQCIAVLVEIATRNVVAPVEIQVGDKPRRTALAKLAIALGFREDVAIEVLAALEKARRAVKVRAELKLKPVIGLAAAGGGLLLMGPLGLIWYAPAELAGGAAIVAALAAFGPGGMVGGLAAAGGLMAAGGTAAGAAVKMLTPEATIEEALARLLAIAIARQRLGEPRDDQIWFGLCRLESQIAREQQRVEPLSDRNASCCRAVRRKAQAVRQALDYMIKIGLGPPHV